MLHALFILIVIIVLGPLIINLLLAAGFAIGAGVAVAGEQLCQVIEDLFSVTIKPIGERVGWFTLAMLVWLLVGALLALGY